MRMTDQQMTVRAVGILGNELLAQTTAARIQVDALLDAVAVNEALARELSRAARNP